MSSKLIAPLFVVGALLSACTNAAVDKAVGAGAGEGIAVSRTATGVVVANNTGRPALGIRLNIELSDGATAYFHIVPTLEPGQKVDLAFTDFHNEEGSLFDPSAAPPKQVKMTGRDTLANHYESTTPW
jgi:hypothetical protein